MFNRGLGELGGEIFSGDGDSVEHVLGLLALRRRVPGGQLREVEEGPDSLEEAPAVDGLLTWSVGEN